MCNELIVSVTCQYPIVFLFESYTIGTGLKTIIIYKLDRNLLCRTNELCIGLMSVHFERIVPG